MPVIGHAFVGIVVAQASEPAALSGTGRIRPMALALWMPALVALSYLPDIATQLGRWMGYQTAQSAGHSLPIGLAAGVLLGLAWARVSGGAPRLLVALATGSILLHDLLDLLQDADRMPLWPFSSYETGFKWLSFQDRLQGELLVFGVPFALYEVWRGRRSRRGPRHHRSLTLTWIGPAAVLAVLLATLGVFLLREHRHEQMDHAQALLRAGRVAEALIAVDAADRWPSSSTTAGDMLRGEAYDRLGDAQRAEAAFRRAYQTDARDFWTVASLAEHYASHGTAAERRQRSAPYVEELRDRFPDSAALRHVLEGIERSISKGAQDSP